ncbi:AAA family ATPase, partial [Eubacteriales bacterium OttesenSCG-928-A19]|nr:AAA family ATPase [Eubacteriales bacterium OttesenSCG-928-A19]
RRNSMENTETARSSTEREVSAPACAQPASPEEAARMRLAGLNPGDSMHRYQWLDMKARTQRRLIPLDKVRTSPPAYLWEPYLREGNLNMLQGDGGVGKTMLAMAIAGAVSTGAMPPGMPGILHGEGDVIYYGAEDDAGEYRLRAGLCGCDITRVHVVHPRAPLPTLTGELHESICTTGARLVVIDPIQAFLGEGIDMHRANEVRPMLDGLREIMRQTRCAALFICHVNKATDMKAAHRALGSVDFGNASRSVLTCGWHPDGSGQRVAIHTKANAGHGAPIAFDIDERGLFQWLGETDASEEAVMRAGRVRPAQPDRSGNVRAMVLSVLAKHGGEWRGTVSQLIDAAEEVVPGEVMERGAVTVGRALANMGEDCALRQDGVRWEMDSRRVYTFFADIPGRTAG